MTVLIRNRPEVPHRVEETKAIKILSITLMVLVFIVAAVMTVALTELRPFDHKIGPNGSEDYPMSITPWD